MASYATRFESPLGPMVLVSNGSAAGRNPLSILVPCHRA